MTEKEERASNNQHLDPLANQVPTSMSQKFGGGSSLGFGSSLGSPKIRCQLVL